MLGDLWGNYSVEDLYRIAIAQPLEQKITSAIALIQTYEGQALQLSPDGYYVAFSGGKDSIVMERLFHMAGVKYHNHYNNVTIDPPELVQFIKKYYPHVPWNNHGRHLLSEVVDHAPGLPTRRGRWCCEIYKEQGGNGCFKSVGVRAEESKRRKGLWTAIRNDKTGPTMAPILYWTKADIWAFIHLNNLPYPTLYDEGFDRLGCVGCPLGGKNRSREFARWPKYEAMWRRGGLAWWEKYSNRLKSDGTFYFAHKFPTFESYWAWWMEEENVNDSDEPDCQMWLW
jgi:phosphoadenosine phosphosulfate reductase